VLSYLVLFSSHLHLYKPSVRLLVSTKSNYLIIYSSIVILLGGQLAMLTIWRIGYRFRLIVVLEVLLMIRPRRHVVFLLSLMYRSTIRRQDLWMCLTFRFILFISSILLIRTWSMTVRLLNLSLLNSIWHSMIWINTNYIKMKHLVMSLLYQL
jgi:hypothetical protein